MIRKEWMRAYMKKRRRLRRKENDAGEWRCEKCDRWLDREKFRKKGKGRLYVCDECSGFVQQPIEKQRECRKCGEMLPYEAFPVRGRGRRYTCSKCLNVPTEYEEEEALEKTLDSV